MADVPAGWQGLADPQRNYYQGRVDNWHRLMSQLYDDLYADLAATRLRDPAAVERLIAFLEADVLCHRSGYFKADAIKELSRVGLSETNQLRLEAVVLDAVDGPTRREFRAYIRLARHLDHERLRAELSRRLTSDEPRTRRHARWVLVALPKSGSEPTAGASASRDIARR